VATVGKNTGVIQAVNKGTATITAYLKDNKKVKASCEVTVKKLKFSIEPLQVTVKVGETKTVTITPNLKGYKYVKIRPESESDLLRMEQKGNKILITGVKPGTVNYYVEGGASKSSMACSYKATVTVVK
jgi:uncharacterized protein YjdB